VVIRCELINGTGTEGEGEGRCRTVFQQLGRAYPFAYTQNLRGGSQLVRIGPHHFVGMSHTWNAHRCGSFLLDRCCFRAWLSVRLVSCCCCYHTITLWFFVSLFFSCALAGPRWLCWAPSRGTSRSWAVR
jgi:hypothetical protein